MIAALAGKKFYCNNFPPVYKSNGLIIHTIKKDPLLSGDCGFHDACGLKVSEFHSLCKLSPYDKTMPFMENGVPWMSRNIEDYTEEMIMLGHLKPPKPLPWWEKWFFDIRDFYYQVKFSKVRRDIEQLADVYTPSKADKLADKLEVFTNLFYRPIVERYNWLKNKLKKMKEKIYDRRGKNTQIRK